MKIKCYSVKLKDMIEISDKAFKAICYDGNSDILPKSTFYGIDYSRTSSDSYWIAAWILEKKNIQYSDKKVSYFNTDTNEFEYATKIVIKKHIPKKIEVKESYIDNDLIRATN